ncbi:hypothetical protein [Reichenbachiella sp.]|uniref:hypothetical protein n=1 Tax=Reichenbachiella sp. TaxID=2184521 RepID=UPI003B5BBA39
MSKITKEQIAEWKEKYTDIYQLEADGKVGYIFDPTSKLSVMKMIASNFSKGSKSVVTESILNNCWLGGDEELKTSDECRNGLDSQIDELINMPEFEIINNSDHAVIQVENTVLKVKYAERADLKYAEHKNRQNKPFDTAIHLLDRLCTTVADLKAIKETPRLYFGYLMAINEVKREKYVGIKKL